MMGKRVFTVIAVTCYITLQCLSGSSGGNLPLNNKSCGNSECDLFEYCTEQVRECWPCSHVCEKGNNFNRETCEEQCQDYIHEYKYQFVRKSAFDEPLKSLKTIQSTLTLVLILLILLVLMIGSIIARFCLNKCQVIRAKEKEKKQYQQKLESVQFSAINGNNTGGRLLYPREGTFDLKSISQSVERCNTNESAISMSEQHTLAPSTSRTSRSVSTSTTTTLPLSLREPCEDSTLDYAAYVNRGLSNSPQSRKM